MCSELYSSDEQEVNRHNRLIPLAYTRKRNRDNCLPQSTFSIAACFISDGHMHGGIVSTLPSQFLCVQL